MRHRLSLIGDNVLPAASLWSEEFGSSYELPQMGRLLEGACPGSVAAGGLTASRVSLHL